jgi:hypothetical protein
MTFIGKFFVVIYTAIALLLLGVSFALYTHRIEWVNRKTSKGVEIKGEIDTLRAKIAQLNYARYQAELRWETQLTALKREENGDEASGHFGRAQRRPWFSQQLRLVETGKITENGMERVITDPVRQLAIDQTTGQLPYASPYGPDSAKLRYRDGGPFLKCAQDYEMEFDTRKQEIADQYARSLLALDRQKKATLECIGDETKKGLETLIAEQVDIRLRAESENQYLTPRMRNRLAELRLLERRRNLLRDRIGELEIALAGGGGR